MAVRKLQNSLLCGLLKTIQVTSSMPALLEIKNVSAYQGSHQVFADLNLTIEEGERIAILGPNGAGKSTLLKLLSREIYPKVNAGSYVKINGSETVKVDELRQKIGMVSHDLQASYNVVSTALEVVVSGFVGAIGLLYQHYPLEEHHYQQALASLKLLGLEELTERKFHHLSTGQQRRVLLARAMIHQPKTLLLDEPTAGLDVKASYELLDQLSALCKNGPANEAGLEQGILLCTHHIEEIIPEIERVILLRNGEIIADAPKNEVLKAELLSELYGLSLQLHQHNGYYQLQRA
ncbi:ATP-binding cassette domain-containing protein [uncultured Pseudoteredinibacter sp.]|uniref:ABC transporter ATP-binding protein n=1 Tax=uncultured Pseudoteredinibacter sp. TaxID=1641701 RepID=UPI0026354373|nr:ATP-binding cassette domain-containing protein [uncultured Pseudoteredinibacter sp.]